MMTQYTRRIYALQKLVSDQPVLVEVIDMEYKGSAGEGTERYSTDEDVKIVMAADPRRHLAFGLHGYGLTDAEAIVDYLRRREEEKS